LRLADWEEAAVRFIPTQDEYGRWAVQDTAQPFRYLFTTRYADEDSAQSMCDIHNATEAGRGVQAKDKLWALHWAIVRYAPPIMRGGS
jgi:hypothetical protein